MRHFTFFKEFKRKQKNVIHNLNRLNVLRINNRADTMFYQVEKYLVTQRKLYDIIKNLK